MHELDSRRAREIFAGDMADRADTGGSEIDLAGICLGIGDQLGNRFGRK